MNKMRKFAALLVLLFLVTLGAVAQSSVGDVWFTSTSVSTQPGQTFTTDVQVNTGTLKLAAYTFKMTFSAIIAVNTAVGTQGVTAGPDGFVTVVNPQATSLTISSFDVTGKAASATLRLLTVNWNAVSNGSTTIANEVQALSNEATVTIGTPRAANSVAVQVGTVVTPTPTRVVTPTPVTPTPTRVVTPTPVTPTPTRVSTPTPTRAVTATPTRAVTATPTRAVTATPTRVVITPTPTRVVITPTPVHPVGEVWFVEPNISLTAAGGTFTTNVQVNTGTQKLAAYTFEMGFSTIISVNTAVGTNGVTAGAQGFVTVVNPQPGKLTISSFDVNGTGPSATLALLSVSWKADSAGTTTITNNVTALSDELTKQIGTTMVGKSIQVSIGGTVTPTPTQVVITPTPTQVVITPTPTQITGCTAASLPLNIDGAITTCKTLTAITNYINSWELGSGGSVKINGVDVTGKWMSAAQLPAKVNGLYTINYVGKNPWSHFEAR